MCELSPQDSAHVLGAISDITTLTDCVNANAASVGDRAFMDHEGLSALLAALRDRAGEAAAWVAAHPTRHAGH